MANRRTHNLRAVLAVPAFRRLLGVRLGGQFSDGVFQAALAGSVLFNPDRQATPTAIALAAAVLVLPYSLVGPFAGVLLDRWSRRSVVVWTNLLRAVLVLPIAALVLAGDEGGLFFVATLVVIGLGRLLLSGLSAATPHVVADERLVTANAVAGTAGSVAYSVGLGCALALLRTVFPAGDSGYGALALLAPAGYVACAVLARVFFARAQLGPDEVVPHRPGLAGEAMAVLRGMVDGVRHLGSARGAAYAMAAQAGFRVLFGALALALLLLYRSAFRADDLTGVSTQLGLVFTAGAAGVLTAAAITPPVSRRIGGWRWVAALLAAVAVAMPVFGLPLSPPLLVLLVLVVNIAGHGIKIVVDTMVQHECADAFRGRVFAVNDTVFNLAYVLGMVGVSAVLPADGRSPALLIGSAAGYACLAGGYAVAAGRWARSVGDDISEPGRLAVVAHH
ncbi:Major Facilitator Superfamily protein [Micromonospora rhizosphaerae]|uniref:Major Facilitator Superfamily protein n=1 Tax=Micromonospora rhizosphaerae TaxID=568872 RepID=A0A1C6RLX0_9ACTN|nr:MFS transporter [Micromonospora rhizosphaerae]SCL18119.1 Major Facilitator Superfamily protein [Micromonospora rhizosphaerae]